MRGISIVGLGSGRVSRYYRAVMLNLLSEFNRIIEALQGSQIRYALAGGLAVAVHGGVRSTEDIDFLVHPDDLDEFKRILRALGYRMSKDPWTFLNSKLTLHRLWLAQPDREELLMVDLLASNTKRHLDMLARAQDEKWALGVLKTLSKKDLIEMKKMRLSAKDQADIETLEGGSHEKGKPGGKRHKAGQ